MAAAPVDGRRAGWREVTAGDWKVKCACELKAQGLKPVDLSKIRGAGRATVYRYLGMDAERMNKVKRKR